LELIYGIFIAADSQQLAQQAALILLLHFVIESPAWKAIAGLFIAAACSRAAWHRSPSLVFE